MSRPPDDLFFDLHTADGVRLRAARAVPTAVRGGIVCCHPHPLFGGTLDNKVVHSLHKAFRDQGFASLRFDFRGAGGSAGEHGHGIAEEQDVAAALDAMEETLGAAAAPALGAAPDLPGARLPLVLGGFSFGSVVGLRHAAHDRRVTHRVAVGPPIEKSPDYDDLHELLAAGDRRPLFLLVGEQDEFCPLPAFLDLVARIRDARVPVTAVLVPGANHFFDRLGHVARQEFERFAFRIGGGSEPARRYEVRDV